MSLAASASGQLRIALLTDTTSMCRALTKLLVHEIQRRPDLQLDAVLVDDVQKALPCAPAIDQLALKIDSWLFRSRLPSSPSAPAKTGYSGDTGVQYITTHLGQSVPDTDVMIDLRAVPGREAADLVHNGTEVWGLNVFRTGNAIEVDALSLAAAPAGAFPVTIRRIAPAPVVDLAEGICNAKISASLNYEQATRTCASLLMRTLSLRVARCQYETAPLGGLRLSPRPTRSDGLAHLARVSRAGALRAVEGAASVLAKSFHLRPPPFAIYQDAGSPLDFNPSQSRPLEVFSDCFLADPFVITHENQTYLFSEVYDYKRQRGFIGAARLEHGQLGQILPVIDDGVHMSFPMIVGHEGALYMYPEVVARDRIEVWKCERFPDRWVRVATALQGEGPVDSSLVRHDGRWWLFTTLMRSPAFDHCSELYLFEADGPLLTNLREHPMNPVVIDTRRARNAGRIFEFGGRLYRPSQDNRFGIYGYGLSLNEVITLSPETYEERTVRSIIGSHHLDVCGDMIVFDVRSDADGFIRRGRMKRALR